MKKILIIVLTLMMTLSLIGCSNKVEVETTSQQVVEESHESKDIAVEEVSKYPLTIKDKFNQEVVIETVPERIISMSPEFTEIIYALGAGDRMVGRSSYCDYPEEALEITDFGSVLDINLESVIEADPDIIFLSSMVDEETVGMFKAQGLVVVTLDKDSSFEGTYEYFKIIGHILDVEEEAEALIQIVETQVAEVELAVAGLEKPTVYYVVYAAEGYDSTATGDTFIHHIVELAGGDNVAAEATNWTYSIEKIVEDNPEIIICSKYWDTKGNIMGLTGYKDLEAVIEGRLFEVDENIFSRQGPRIGEAVKALAQILHPEVF